MQEKNNSKKTLIKGSKIDSHVFVKSAEDFSHNVFLFALVSFFLGIGFLIYFTFSLLLSDHATVVDIPHSVSTRPSYKLNTYTNSDTKTLSNSVSRFTRDLFIVMAPRRSRDVESFYSKLQDFTSPGFSENRVIRGVLRNIDREKSAVENGNFARIYKSKMPESLRISRSGDMFYVEVDLVFIQHHSGSEYRFTPSCNLEISIGERTMSNEYGLYLSFMECFQLIDATSGERRKIQIIGGYSPQG